jgi:glycosyltransferase involved in cell wall biosynthesis
LHFTITSLADHIHIVSFDIPYPADYGGVMDVFYKIKALHQIGVKVHLHCFEYGRPHQNALNDLCEEVHYYKRKEGHKGFSLEYPYIVSSRNDDALWERLNADAYPVLLEGVHCTLGLLTGKLNKTNVAIRLHNVEYEYYKQLGEWEKSLFKKAYMRNESRLLKRYEEQLINYKILALSEQDLIHYKRNFKAKNIHFIPPFIPNRLVTCKEGIGTYVLYHGNLSVAENEKAAAWLLEKIFSELEIPFVIAGKNPSERLKNLAHAHQHTCIVENPSEGELQDLIHKAQLHILPSFTETGIKFKLLNSVFSGRHVIANDEMLKGAHLERACQSSNNVTEFKYHTFRLFHKQFTNDDLELRQGLLMQHYNNAENAAKLMRALL